MARRSSIELSDKLVKIQVKPRKVSVKPWVVLQLNYPVRYRYVSSKTGNEYIWERAGFRRSVHPDDAPDLLAKCKKAGCCGASPQINFIFEEVK